MQIIIGIFAVLAIIAASVWGVAAFEGHHAQSLQAQATRDIARAAQISSAGQTIATTGLSVITVLVLLLVVLAAVAGIFFWLKTRQRQGQQRRHTQPSIFQPLEQANPFGGVSNPMMGMLMLQMLQQMQALAALLAQRGLQSPADPFDELPLDAGSVADDYHW